MNEIITQLLPKRNDNSNKSKFGTLCVIAGSEKYRGAAGLAVNSALRCGVGIVRLVSVEKVIAAVSAGTYECTFEPVAANADGSMSAESFSSIKPWKKTNAILAGCGMTNCEDTRRIVNDLIYESGLPLVLDADALNSIADDPSILKESAKPVIITPHIGEMSRLCGLPCDKITASRENVAADFANKYNVTVILKDYITTVSSPDGRSYICNSANSGLSKGGSGDVLAGIAASFSAQGMMPFDAAKLAVNIHSEAGKSASDMFGKTSMLPSDIISMISEVTKI